MIGLALKYRPQSFEDIVGQSSIKQILLNQINTHKIKPAYMFIGASGVGKTTAGRIFARDINDGADPIELDCASNNSVDDIRNIIKETKTKPMSGKYKVFLLDEVQSLSGASNSALLKILEEPPSTNIFILCTTNPEKVLDTIRTRCQVYKFKPLSIEQIIGRLKHICIKENIQAPDDCLLIMAMKAKGSMRQAIQNLEMCNDYGVIDIKSVEQCLGVNDYDVQDDFLWALYSKDLIKVTEILEQNYLDVLAFIRQFENYLIQLIKYSISHNELNVSVPITDKFKDSAYKITYINLVSMLSFTKTLIESMAHNDYKLQTVENIIISKLGVSND